MYQQEWVYRENVASFAETLAVLRYALEDLLEIIYVRLLNALSPSS